MSERQLARWMKQRGFTVVDLASMTKLHPVTITNFLKGKRVQWSTRALIERVVRDIEDQRLAKAGAA